jgi:hypothetical protein
LDAETSPRFPSRLHIFCAALPQPLAGTLVLAQLASNKRFRKMNGIIYIVGLVVIIMAILSFIGLN